MLVIFTWPYAWYILKNMSPFERTASGAVLDAQLWSLHWVDFKTFFILATDQDMPSIFEAPGDRLIPVLCSPTATWGYFPEVQKGNFSSACVVSPGSVGPSAHTKCMWLLRPPAVPGSGSLQRPVSEGMIHQDCGVLWSLGPSHCLNKVISFGLLSGCYSVNILIQYHAEQQVVRLQFRGVNIHLPDVPYTLYIQHMHEFILCACTYYEWLFNTTYILYCSSYFLLFGILPLCLPKMQSLNSWRSTL